ncbi:hypothetical protein V8E36_005321 [Tilletia maclaganii]
MARLRHSSTSRPSRRRWTAVGAATTAAVACLSLVGLTSAVPLHTERQSSSTTPLSNNQTFINLAISTIDSSQRASWEQGVAVQAILEWQYPQWTTWNAPDSTSFLPATAYRGKNTYPNDVVLQAMRSVVAQDSNGRLGARVTGDENPNKGSSLDSASNLESVLVAALAAGQIGPSGTLNTNLNYGRAASRAWSFITTKVNRGAGGIISQRMDQLQYWADMLYMGPPSMAAYGLYTQSADALQLAYDQVRLEMGVLLYPPGSGAKSGLMGHIRNEDGSWPDSNVWLTGQGWTLLGNLRVVAALAQSGGSSGKLSNSTASNIVELLRLTSGVLNATHALFDPSVNLWHNYVDTPSSFADISGSLAVAASTYRLAILAPSLITPTHLSQAEAVYRRVIPQLRPNGQFGGGLACVDALAFSAPGWTSVEALSFGVLLEAARRDWSRVVANSGHAVTSVGKVTQAVMTRAAV